ncbi:MAG TPA: SIMPL domain-containing protein [Steroidobacteraceae bacterium]|nr:SIMPL domain-containing protein [Steroidobacteraceae bacterium]
MKLPVAIALTAATSWAIAQPYPGSPAVPRPATIQVTGEAQVSETPDRVYIDIGVSTRAPRSEDAASHNAARVATVIAAVKRAAGPDAQLTTTEYSVSPDYSYPRGGGTATVVGYTVSNVVQVRLDDLRRVGGVIDAATQAGSNTVQNIRFALRDEQVPRNQALRQAVLNASQDAGALADALGLKVVRVLAVDEGSPQVEPVYPRGRVFAQVQAAAAPTPVETGTLDVSATVTLTVEVAPASR